MKQLFTVQIPPIESHPGGTVTIATLRPQTYLLTISSPPDNRLTTPTCHALVSALGRLAATQPVGVLLITSSLPKFFSNGLDLDHVLSPSITPEVFFPQALYPLWHALLTYPMPTVAVINGHAFAGGFMTGMMCDYRIMNPSRGYLCLNEVHFGALLKAPMSSIFREKVSAQTYRHVVLEGRRFAGAQALEVGLVDALGGLEEALGLIDQRKLLDVIATGVYGGLRAEMYRKTFEFLSQESFEVEEKREKALVKGQEDWVAKYEEETEKSKL